MIKEYLTSVIDYKFVCNEISSELYVKLLEKIESMSEEKCELFLEQALVSKGAYTPAFKTIMGYRPKSWIPASKTITGAVKKGLPASKTITGHRIYPSAASKIGTGGKVKRVITPDKPITKIVKKSQEVTYR